GSSSTPLHVEQQHLFEDLRLQKVEKYPSRRSHKRKPHEALRSTVQYLFKPICLQSLWKRRLSYGAAEERITIYYEMRWRWWRRYDGITFGFH
ncbi:hypothetical protein SK128_000900, partial [Halocaridina rubra]